MISVSLHLRAALALLCIASSCSACAPWPTPGAGGAAERYGTDWHAALVLEARYDRLSKSGGGAWSPAKMLEARELLVRARRENAGQLHADAEASLGSAEALVAWIERDMMRRVRSSGG